MSYLTHRPLISIFLTEYPHRVRHSIFVHLAIRATDFAIKTTPIHKTLTSRVLSHTFLPAPDALRPAYPTLLVRLFVFPQILPVPRIRHSPVAHTQHEQRLTPSSKSRRVISWARTKTRGNGMGRSGSNCYCHRYDDLQGRRVLVERAAIIVRFFYLSRYILCPHTPTRPAFHTRTHRTRHPRYRRHQTVTIT